LKIRYAYLLVATLLPITLLAQAPAKQPQFSETVYLDTFGGADGVVFYPQYGWSLRTKAGNLSGYGFIEVAPKEPTFTNHLVIYTSPKAPMVSVHTETGGIPHLKKGFFQVGPRFNATAAAPKALRSMQYLFVTYLPHVSGIRPNNLLIAGGTKQFQVRPGLKVSAEGYRRVFGNNRADYSEYWLLLHPAKTKHVSFGAFVLKDGSRTSLFGGVRVSQ